MAKRERFKLSLSVFLMLVKEDKLLLIKRSNTGWMDGYYSVPAGALDGHENLVEAVIREAKEEINADIVKKNVKLVHTMHNLTHGEEWIGAFFIADKWKGNIIVNEPEKHSEVRWVSVNRLPKNTVPYVKEAFKAFKKKKIYSNYGWNEK